MPTEGGVSDYAGAIMQIIPMLFGSSQEATQHGTSNTRSNTSQSGKTQGNSQSMSDSQIAMLENLSQLLQGNAGQFSKQNAMADSAGLQQQAVRGLREGALPQIAGAEAASGGYNSTSKTLLQNDAVNRASDSLAQLRLNAILGYGNLQNSNLSASAQALAALKGSKVSTNETSDINVSGTIDTQNQSVQNQDSPGLFSKIF